MHTGGTWEMTDDAVVRVATLAVADYSRTCSVELHRGAVALVELRRRLADRADLLSEDLAALVPTAASPAQRRALLAVRRGVHNLRAASAVARDLATSAPPEPLAGRVAGWCRDKARYEDERARLEALLGGERDRVHRELLALAERPRMRAALEHAGGDWAGELDRLRRRGARKGAHAKLRHLHSYLARATFKTSPFSYFTAVGMARWADRTSPTLVLHDDADLRLVRDVPEPEALPHGPGRRVRPNPSVTRIGPDVVYLRPGPREALVRLGGGAVLDRALEVLGATCPAHSAGAPVATCGACRAALAADDDVDELVRAGLVETPPPAGTTGVIERGTPTTAVSAGAVATLSADALAPIARDLAAVTSWLSPFDRSLPVKLAAADFVAREHGGRPMPFLELCLLVGERVRSGPAGSDLAGLLRNDAEGLTAGTPEFTHLFECRSERIRSLAGLQETAVARILSAPRDPGRGTVPRAALDGAVAGWPDWLPIHAHSANYVQLLDPAEPVRCVLNASHGGRGRGVTRTRYLTDRAGGNGAGPGATALPHTAEILNGSWSPLNRRAPRAGLVLDYPGADWSDDPRPRVPLSDLVVRTGEDGLLRLESATRGHRIDVGHLGMTTGSRLRSTAKLLHQLFDVDYIFHPAASPLIPFGATTPDRPVVALPPIGTDRVVLRRRSWLFDRTALPPGHRAGPLDLDGYQRVVGWADDHGLPPRFFVRVLPADPGAGPRVGKPLHVDLANLYGVETFLSTLEGCSSVLVEECLPDLRAPGRGPGRAVELLLTIGATGAGR